MPNKPRANNRHRMVRVEDELWEAARGAAERKGTTRAEVMRQALRELVESETDVRGSTAIVGRLVRGELFKEQS